MPHANPAFTTSEYARRLAQTRAAMARAGVDVLYVQDPSNIAWLTGYDGWSFYVHQGAVIFHDADPVWWGRNQDTNGAVRTVWMDTDRIRGYDDRFVQSTVCHPMEDLAGILRDTGHSASRIGVEMDNYYYSAKAHLTLRDALPEASFVDATALVNWERAIKSDEELLLMRKAARISEKVIDGVFERIEPGMRKNELVAEMYRDAIIGVGEDWGDYAAIVPLVPAGSDAAAPHLTWDGAPLRNGEGVFFEIAGCFRRYHTPICRSVYFGTPPDAVKRAEAALIEGLEAGLEAARAGHLACDIAAALAAPLERAGIDRGARCGYPIGLSYPPDWGERTISLRAEDKTVLRPGMTFHFMPGLWMDDWGIEITESILITEDGPASCFCNRARNILVKN